MYDNEPSRHNRNGARPKYILLLVDGGGRHWLWRTTDDALLTIEDAEIVGRGRVDPDDSARSPETIVATVADECGVTRAPYGKQYNATVADALEAM